MPAALAVGPSACRWARQVLALVGAFTEATHQSPPSSAPCIAAPDGWYCWAWQVYHQVQRRVSPSPAEAMPRAETDGWLVVFVSSVGAALRWALDVLCRCLLGAH